MARRLLFLMRCDKGPLMHFSYCFAFMQSCHIISLSSPFAWTSHNFLFYSSFLMYYVQYTVSREVTWLSNRLTYWIVSQVYGTYSNYQRYMSLPSIQVSLLLLQDRWLRIRRLVLFLLEPQAHLLPNLVMKPNQSKKSDWMAENRYLW